jgi:hypothetical protein
MASRGKLGRLCQALLIAVSVVALSGAAAQAQPANDLEDLNRQILDNPQDLQLNLRYAEAAERAGMPRLALAAYERILINDPSNAQAREGYERIRRVLEPGYLVSRIEIGARWDSNALSVNEDTFSLSGDQEEATTYYARFMAAHEGAFVGRRWRSIAAVDVEVTPDIEELDYSFIGLQTGPIFYVGPHTALLPAIGAGATWLDGDQYFNEINLGLTVEGRMAGASYWWRLRGGYRDYAADSNSFFDTVTEQGPYAELRAGLTKPRLFAARDTLLVAPFVRWSDIEGTIYNFWISDWFSPGKYVEYGADVSYNYQLTDHLKASVGVLVRERAFAESSRDDTYISPHASLALQGVLPCNCDVELRYRRRDNDSNDYSANYIADQVSLALLTRF